MEYHVSLEEALTQPTQLLVLPVYSYRRLHPTTEAFDTLCDGYLSRLVKRSSFSGDRAESMLLLDVPHAAVERVLLIGCGRRSSLDARRFLKVAHSVSRAMQETGAEEAVSCLSHVSVKRRDLAWIIRQLIETGEAERYRFDKTRSVSPHRSVTRSRDNGERSSSEKTSRKKTLARVTFNVQDPDQLAAARHSCTVAVAIAAGTCYARDLGNLPGNICTPDFLAQQARALSDEYSSLQTTILDESALRELGCGALLAVSQGSLEPACLIVMQYRAGPANQKPIALVGKGITFDTGGLSIKPAAGMMDMKFDMCGAACVFGALKACLDLALPINVVALVAAAENMPGPGAVKPNDVVTTLSGRTVEVLNTDAEGRLVLCDALTYAQRFKPATTIDVATLTGSCKVALGRHVHGLFSNSDSLTRQLVSAGRRANDRPWPMPLMEDYQSVLDSKYADMANIGGNSAGAITAACFLWRFTRDMRWAHLDIAGTAADSTHKGSTGRPVPLLTQFLIDRAEKNSAS